VKKTRPSAAEELLKGLDKLLKTKGLHCKNGQDAWAPVCIGRLLEEAIISYQPLPSPVLGVSTQWNGDAGITFNDELREPHRSADKRYGEAHEFGHIFRRHRGQFIVWRSGSSGTEGKYNGRGARWEEREADMAAALSLIPLQALREMRDMQSADIARHLDVPEHLVKLRFEIWKKHHK
jgi:hypothetical protein